MTSTDIHALLFVWTSAILAGLAVSKYFGDAVARLGVSKQDLFTYRLSCFGLFLSAVVLATWWFKGGRP